MSKSVLPMFSSQTHRRRTNLWLLGGRGVGKDRLAVWDWCVHTAIFKTGNQQGLPVQHRELCSIFFNKLNGEKIWKRIDTCICITESLCYTPETVCSVTQLCLTLCNPMDCSTPDSSIHGIFQARILEWVAISSSRGSSWPRNGNHISLGIYYILT